MHSRTLSVAIAVLLSALPGLAASQQASTAGGADLGGVVPLPATTLPRTHTPRPTKPAISPADLMTRLYIFADDSMQGR